MKFCYVDESGDPTQSDTFVMAGILIDAYRLRRKTEEVDDRLQDVLAKHPGAAVELKTKAFMRGKGGWNAVSLDDRKALLADLCRLGVDKGNKIYSVAISFAALGEHAAAAEDPCPFANSYWLCAAMFVTALVQKRMQTVADKKGITALVVDENQKEMSKLSNALFSGTPWYDGLYQQRVPKKGWKARTDDDRFDHIINTGFAIKSEHSSLVQVSDAVAWVFRRDLELRDAEEEEEWPGERVFYADLAAELEDRRITLGQTAPCPAKDFYAAICHNNWKL